LGDMLELGKSAAKIHKELSKHFKGLKKDSEILLIGKNMANLFAKLEKEKFNVKYFKRRDALKKYLNELNYKNAAVLIKGSRGMKMEEFIQTITEKAA
jgi:UDP-N-acetylmuramoyl-tripeptide--D-alanyl-D-alanine ligase